MVNLDTKSNMQLLLQCHVIHGSDIAQDLQTLIEPEDLSVIVSSTHRPRCIIDFISQTLRMLNLEESKLNVLVIPLSDVLYGCLIKSNKSLNIWANLHLNFFPVPRLQFSPRRQHKGS